MVDGFKPLYKKSPIQFILEYIDKSDTQNAEKLWGKIYLSTVIISLVIGYFIPLFCLFNNLPLQFNQESARYLLSSFIQSQAAILAIVISLTLIAVQFTASEYSPRFIDVFKKHPALWLITLMYILSMSIDSILLLYVSENITLKNGSIVSTYLFSVSFFVCLLIVLIPHIRVTMNHLNASNIIERLISQISVENIKPETDPFQPAFDVIYGAIKKDDYTTMSVSLKSACEKFVEIISEKETTFEKSYISFRFFDDIRRCGYLLIEKNEERFTFEVLIRINDIASRCVQRKDTIVLEYSIKVLQDIGLKAIPKKFQLLIDNILETFDTVYNDSKKFDNFLKNTGFLPEACKRISVCAIEFENYQVSRRTVLQLCKYLEENIESDIGIGNGSVECLQKIVEESIKHDVNLIRDLVLKCLYRHSDKTRISDPHSLHGYVDFVIRQLHSEYGVKIPDKNSF